MAVLTRGNSFKCNYCDRTWPMNDDYAVCPICREETSGSITPPMPAQEARELKIHADFGWWLYTEGRL